MPAGFANELAATFFNQDQFRRPVKMEEWRGNLHLRRLTDLLDPRGHAWKQGDRFGQGEQHDRILITYRAISHNIGQ